MPEGDRPAVPLPPQDAEQRRAARARAAALLGDAVESRTHDDSDQGWSESSAERSREAELRRDVPPHHGG